MKAEWALEQRWFERVAPSGSGRAVAAFSLGVALTKLTILPSDIARRYAPAHAKHSPQSGKALAWKDREKIDAQITVAFAAPAAEAALAGPRNLVAARVEHDDTATLAASVCGSDEETIAYLAWLGDPCPQPGGRGTQLAGNSALAARLMKDEQIAEADVRNIIKRAVTGK